MAFTFSATTPNERDEVVAFLLRAFNAQRDALFVERGLLDWKYYVPRSDWAGSRSYVVRDEAGSIAAHACAWPVETGGVQTVRVIDWAAPDERAARELLENLVRIAGSVIALGHSAQSRQIAAILGAETRGSVDFYGAVVNPWLHYQAGPVKGWKGPVKMVRNALQNRLRVPEMPQGWTSVAVGNAGDFLLSCPAGRFLGYSLMKDGKPAGRYVLNQTLCQTRIVELECADADAPPAWAVAVRTAATLPGTAEVVAASSADSARRALAGCWLRLHHSEPVHVCDRSGRLGGGELKLMMSAGDEAWFGDPGWPFLW